MGASVLKYSTKGGLLVLLVLVAVVTWGHWHDRPVNHGVDAMPKPQVAVGAARTLADAWRLAGHHATSRDALLVAAQERRNAFMRLMVDDPAAALEEAISVADYVALPEPLKPYYERPVSGRGDVDLLWETQEHPSSGCQHYNMVRLDGRNFRVAVPGMHMLPVLKGAPVTGIALGDQVVLHPGGVQRLADAEVDAALALFPMADHGGLDPMIQRPAGRDHAALIDGEVHLFASDLSVVQVETMLTDQWMAAEQAKGSLIGSSLPWLAGNAGGDSGVVAGDPPLSNHLDVLFVRVDFSDFPGEVVSKATLENTLATVNTHLGNISYGAANVTYTVSNAVYRMPKTGTFYAQNGDNDGLQIDARTLASANYTLANYDVISVIFPSLSGVANSLITYGGLASIGGDKQWFNGFSASSAADLITHEFGHNYGAFHANFLDPAEAIGQPAEYELPGVLEYGDIFDIMGAGSLPNGDMNMLIKNQLNWLPDGKVSEATSDGIYTIYRFDHPSALANPMLALKVPAAGNSNYWIGFRQSFTGNSYNLKNAAYVVAENLGEGGETCLIDMTPGSQGNATADRTDAGLLVGGASFYDANAGVTLTATQQGGTAPNQWIKVQVAFSSRIRVADTAITVDEQSGTAEVVVERVFGQGGAITVNYSTANGTATSGSDYYPVSGTLSWAHGDSSSRTIVIPIRPNAAAEGLEQFTLNLSGISGGVLDGGASTCTISLVEAGQRMTDFAPGFFNNAVYSIAPLADGKVLIGGFIGNISEGGSSIPINHIARLNADGTVDTTFLTGTGCNGQVNVVVVQDDGKALVGGQFTSYNGTACNRLVRLNANGTVDSTFVTAMGTAANGEVFDIATEVDGDILVAGAFTSFAGTACKGIMRLTSAGAVDVAEPLASPAFTAFGRVRSIVAQADGKIMIAGAFYQPEASWARSGILRLNGNGSIDASFSPGNGAFLGASLGDVYKVVRLRSGKYLVVGYFTLYNGNAANYCVRVNANGSFDNTFVPPAFNNPCFTAVEQASAAVVVGGAFNSPVPAVERLLTGGSADPGFDQGTGPGGPVYALAQGADGALWVGGNYFSYNGVTSRPVVKIAGGQSPYDRWVVEHFTTAQVSGGQSAAAADPDLDGRENLEEWAMGTDPNVADGQLAFEVRADDGVAVVQAAGQNYLQVSFDKPQWVPGVWYVAQFSNDLVNWLPVSPVPGSNATYDVIEDSALRFTVRDKSPVPANPRRNCRIRLMSPQ